MENQIVKFEKSAELANVFTTREVNEENPEIRHTTTYDENTLFNSLRGKSEAVKDYLGEEIEVINIVITSADVDKNRENPDEGKENKPIVHFFTSDGKHLSTMSNGIVRNVKALFEIGKIPTEENPVRIRFDEVQTKKGVAHTFELV